MYWPDQTRENDKYLLRGKIFPPAVKVPDFKSTDWNPKGIQIGGFPTSWTSISVITRCAATSGCPIAKPKSEKNPTQSAEKEICCI